MEVRGFIKERERYWDLSVLNRERVCRFGVWRERERERLGVNKGLE